MELSMIKLANSIALPLGTSQESSDFKAFLESILPPEPEYGEPCPDSNKFYHCYELMDEDGHISADKLIEIYGIEHASTFAVFTCTPPICYQGELTPFRG